MLRRSVVLLAALAAALAVVPFAAAALVHVRIEGKTVTLFGQTQPRVEAATPLEALERAAVAGELYYHVTSSSFGNYVDQVGLYGGTGDSGWVFKVNGVSPPVGADQVQLKDGDVVEWYYAVFGPAGGPPTLGLYRKGRCYRVAAFDDQGKESAAPDAVLHVGGRTLKASFTGTCIGRHQGLVWASAPGAVRSNRLP